MNLSSLQLNNNPIIVNNIINAAAINLFNDASIRTSLACSTDARVRQTGLVSGGTLTNNADTTKFNLNAGSGWIVDQSTITKTILTWSTFSTQTPTFLTTSASSWIGIQDVGGVATIVQSADPFTAAERRNTIVIGRLSHFNKTTINGHFTLPTRYSESTAATNVGIALSVVLEDGFLISANANLTFSYTAAVFYRLGCNYSNATTNDSTATVAADNIANIFRVYRTGADDIVVSAATTTIDPLSFDNGSGTLQTVPVNRYTIQWVVVYPYGTSATIFVLYGQDLTYLSLQDAINDLGYNIDIHSPVKGGMIRAAIIIRQDQTVLTTAITNGYAKIVMFNKVGK
jgi:hypothetical protein